MPEQAESGIAVLYHDVWVNRPDYADSAPGGGVRFNSAILEQARALVGDRDDTVVYATLFGGNGHVVFGLVRHPRPFDVVLPEMPDLPLDDTAELVPHGYLDAAMHEHAAPYLWQMLALRQAVPGRVLCLETPPPYADDAYVRDHLGSYVPNPGNVVSAALRLKLWRLHSRKLRLHCEASGVEFVPAPAEAIEPPGFMAREGYGPDATHGNAWYGERVLRQIEASLGQPIGAVREFA